MYRPVVDFAYNPAPSRPATIELLPHLSLLRREESSMRSWTCLAVTLLLFSGATAYGDAQAESLWNAAKAGNVEQVLALLDAGIEVDAPALPAAAALLVNCGRSARIAACICGESCAKVHF